MGYKIFFLPNLEKQTFDWNSSVIKDKELEKRFNYFQMYIAKELIKKDIKFLMTDKVSRDNLLHYAAISTCKYTNTVSKLYDHGEAGHCFDNDIYNRGIFDVWYITNIQMHDYISNKIKEFDLKTMYMHWNRPKKKVKKKKHNRFTIMFAPMFTSDERMVHLLPETIKYKIKKEMLEVFQYMIDKYNVRVIYKKFSAGEENDDCIKELIEMKYPKIELVDGKKFNKCLSISDMMITDCISTTFFDALYNNIEPLVLLHHRTIPLIPRIEERYNRFIRWHYNIDDIQQVVENYYKEINKCY
jgi:hypothetical protein